VGRRFDPDRAHNILLTIFLSKIFLNNVILSQMSGIKSLSIYVIHYSKLVERKTYLQQALSSNALIAEWITENDTESFTSSELNSKKILGISPRFLGMDLGVNSRSLVFSRRRARIQGWILLARSFFTFKQNTYSTGSLPERKQLPTYQLEIQRMHLTALRKGATTASKWILILEDDAIPDSKVKVALENIIKKYINSRTWINLNSGADLTRTKSDPFPDENGIFRVKPAGTRCTVAYLVSNDLAQNILDLVAKNGVPAWLPIDLVYQAALRKTKAKAYWQEPVLFRQGSEEGFYLSNLDGRRA